MVESRVQERERTIRRVQRSGWAVLAGIPTAFVTSLLVSLLPVVEGAVVLGFVTGVYMTLATLYTFMGRRQW